MLMPNSVLFLDKDSHYLTVYKHSLFKWLNRILYDSVTQEIQKMFIYTTFRNIVCSITLNCFLF